MKNMSAIAPAISTGNCAGDLTGNSNGKRRDPRMLTVIAGRARLRSLRKNQGFVSGHRLRACGKIEVSYQGIASAVIAET